MFKVGQKVVCIYDTCDPNWRGSAGVEKGQIYRIRELRDSPDYPGQTSVLLMEINNEINPFSGLEFGFLSRAFRPLVSTSTRQSRQAIIDNLIKQPELV